ncbi:unnamed protein product [Pleuronectes platessa]|uniref:Uncharacterized protein n=1 Tax=Pleuronectes platessa TaxID=8262 RepID=A0A9N7YK00_PLEPL|nr:unnamed protein product [Pleuronectes platessa]
MASVFILKCGVITGSSRRDGARDERMSRKGSREIKSERYGRLLHLSPRELSSCCRGFIPTPATAIDLEPDLRAVVQTLCTSNGISHTGPRPRVFLRRLTSALWKQTAGAAVQTHSFVPLNRDVTIDCQTADTKPPLVECSGPSGRPNVN